jgi:hypothetical protein
MVAYSYKRRFVDPIRIGLCNSIAEVAALDFAHWMAPKRQTIRGPRGGHGHARPGQLMHHFCAMRTKQCFLIGIGRCIEVPPIALAFKAKGHGRSDRVVITHADHVTVLDRPDALDSFAKSDGFQDWFDMRQFWNEEHDGVERFEGFLLRWEPIRRENDERYDTEPAGANAGDY